DAHFHVRRGQHRRSGRAARMTLDQSSRAGAVTRPSQTPAAGARAGTAMTGAERLLAACRRQPADATPVWFMRQAGRSLAAYRKLREQYPIMTLAKPPELSAQITLMPVAELGV